MGMLSRYGINGIRWIQCTKSIISYYDVDLDSWSVPDPVAEYASGGAKFADVAKDVNGNIAVSWAYTDSTSNTSSIYAKYFTQSDNSWSIPQPLGTYDYTDAEWAPHAAIDNNGNAVVLWSEWINGTSGFSSTMQASYYSAGTQSWTTEQLNDLNLDNEHAIQSQLVMNPDGTVQAIWSQFDGQNQRVYTIRHGVNPTNDLVEWYGGQYIDTTIQAGSGSARPQLVMLNNGDAMAVWGQTADFASNSGWQNFVSYYDSTNQTWSDAQALQTTDGEAISDPQLAINQNDQVRLVWMQTDGTTWNIYSRQYDAPTDTWGDNELVESNNGQAWYPQIILDAAGNSTAVWSHFGGTQSGILASRQEVGQQTNRDYTSVNASVGVSPGDIHTFQLYNARGQHTGTINGEGYLTETVYDQTGNVHQTIRYSAKANAYVPGVTIDDVRPSTMDTDATGAFIQDQVSTYHYNARNQLTTSINAEGTVTEYRYDDVGNRTSKTTSVGGIDNNAARTQTSRYDSQGRLTGSLNAEGSEALRVLNASGSSTSEAVELIWAQHGTQHFYDSAGRRIHTTDQWGNTTYYYYNEDSQLRYSVNDLGEFKEVVYNEFGQAKETIAYATRLNDTPENGNALTTIKSIGGGLINTLVSPLLTPVLDPQKDSKTSSSNNLRGLVKAAIDGEQYKTEYNYNAFGELKNTRQQIDAPGVGLDTLLTSDNSVLKYVSV